jgi:Kelch motif
MMGFCEWTNRRGFGAIRHPNRTVESQRDRVRRPEVEAVEARTLLSGSWTRLAEPAPADIGTMLLLTNGTVMAQDSGTKVWYDLKPNAYGSYVHATWSPLHSMYEARLYYASAVLPDGDVFVAGGEFPEPGSSTAEIYNPITNTWKYTPAQGYGVIGDAPAKLLTNGDIILAPEEPTTFGTQTTVLYNPATDSWSPGPNFYRDPSFSYLPGVTNRSANETNWVLLPDGSILTADNDSYAEQGATGNEVYASERYIPSLNQWVNDGTVPVDLWYKNAEGYGDTGPGVLLNDGLAFFLGASGHTAIYTPSAQSNQPGVWTAGPDIPHGLGSYDGTAIVLSNGNVLCAVGPKAGTGPTSFVEYNPVTNRFTDVPNVPNYACQPFTTRFLALPNGEALFADSTKQLYVYNPGGAPQASWRPIISNIQRYPYGSYNLTGIRLDGVSEGAYYGDDAQMSTNYPIVRLTNSSNHVYYAPTTNWTIGVASETPESTDFTLPTGLPGGKYRLSVIANGIASRAVAFSTDR